MAKVLSQLSSFLIQYFDLQYSLTQTLEKAVMQRWELEKAVIVCLGSRSQGEVTEC